MKRDNFAVNCTNENRRQKSCSLKPHLWSLHTFLLQLAWSKLLFEKLAEADACVDFVKTVKHQILSRHVSQWRRLAVGKRITIMFSCRKEDRKKASIPSPHWLKNPLRLPHWWRNSGHNLSGYWKCAYNG